MSRLRKQIQGLDALTTQIEAFSRSGMGTESIAYATGLPAHRVHAVRKRAGHVGGRTRVVADNSLDASALMQILGNEGERVWRERSAYENERRAFTTDAAADVVRHRAQLHGWHVRIDANPDAASPPRGAKQAEVLEVLVTGDKHAVAQEAARRGIPFAFKREARVGGKAETTGRVAPKFEPEVRNWFNETLDAPTLSVLTWKKVWR